MFCGMEIDVKENFDSAFTALELHEHGYSNNPADPGGETMYGITKRVAEARGYAGEMKDLPLDLAKSIAKAEYWDAIYCDELPSPLDFQVFDACYNSGQGRTLAWLEDACRIPRGGLSPKTAGANFPVIVFAYMDNPMQAVIRFDAYRLLFLDSLPTWPTFGRGWARRIAENLLRAAA